MSHQPSFCRTTSGFGFESYKLLSHYNIHDRVYIPHLQNATVLSWTANCAIRPVTAQKRASELLRLSRTPNHQPAPQPTPNISSQRRPRATPRSFIRPGSIGIYAATEILIARALEHSATSFPDRPATRSRRSLESGGAHSTPKSAAAFFTTAFRHCARYPELLCGRTRGGTTTSNDGTSGA